MISTHTFAWSVVSRGAHAPSRALCGAPAAKRRKASGETGDKSRKENGTACSGRDSSAGAPKRTREGACAPRISLLAALLLFCFCCSASQAVEANTFSPVVSYQYLDTLAEPGTTITSPVVSYQYFDWPGDKNLAFTNSPNVSYYFNGAPQIFTQPLGKAVMVGQTVMLSVVAEGSSPLSYRWRLNGVALPNTNAASMQVSNAQNANSGSYSVVVQNLHGSVVSNDASVFVYSAPVTPQPPTPATAQATQTPSAVQLKKPGVTPSSAQLLSFGNPALVDKSRMTIVLTHGWNATAFDWPQAMANELKAKYNANVLAWDWHDNSLLLLSNAASRTVAEGSELGRALMNTLGPTYDQPIHFIGHSLGTIVNCAAADYIHGDKRPRGDPRPLLERYASGRTHMTLFDEAELVTAVKGLHVSLDALLASTGIGTELAITDASQQVKNFWSKVMPAEFAWADNYLSEVGLLNPRAANVMLWASTDLRNPIAAHGYAYYWYQLTIKNPLGSGMGHRWSFERATLNSTPPVAAYHVQKQPELLLANVEESAASSLQQARILAYPGLLALRGLNGAGKITVQAMNTIGNGTIRFAGSLTTGIDAIFKAPVGRPVYLEMAGSTPAFYAEGPASTNALEANWDLKLDLQAGTPAPLQLRAPFKAIAMANAAPNAVYTIIPVHVPNETIGVSFEYQITGGGTGEFMTMGIGEENSYTMEAELVEDGGWNGTPVIETSDYVNQDVQLVFALNGVNASPSGALSVRNIQFYIPPRPQLTLSVFGSELTASWPLSAIDWTLEQTSDLSLPNGWQPEPGMPEDTDYFHTMTFDISTVPRGFFRLRK